LNSSFAEFLKLPRDERQAVFEATAERLDTLASYIEKDFWVCVVLDALYNGLPDGHPQLLFKGGTSLSKAFHLIRRFSEDIDIVVFRKDLGFESEGDPTNPQADLSNKRRQALFHELRSACSEYICGRLYDDLSTVLAGLDEGCRVDVDKDAGDQQALLVQYPGLFSTEDLSYVRPRVKIEGGARSALDPNVTCKIAPYIETELSDWKLSVGGVTTIQSARTFWEKILILHGAHCGLRDEKRLPRDRDRISRHYYDVAMIGESEAGKSALNDRRLWDNVREHNLIAFKQAWKKFDEAVPGTTCVVPQPELRAEIEKDYAAMQGMILGETPSFDWITDRLAEIEETINQV